MGLYVPRVLHVTTRHATKILATTSATLIPPVSLCVRNLPSFVNERREGHPFISLISPSSSNSLRSSRFGGTRHASRPLKLLLSSICVPFVSSVPTVARLFC